MNSPTLDKFDYPNKLIKSYQYWHLLLRFQQPTIGSLILFCKEDVSAYADISPEAAKEQNEIVAELEIVLKNKFNYDKINYLMLMMVDPEVHFHIIPRYENSLNFDGKNYHDEAWPGPANLGLQVDISASSTEKLLSELKQAFSEEQSKHSQQFDRIYTSGCFDIFHHGHLNILRRSKALCNHLIVGVSTDELILKEKGRAPVVPYEERASIISSIKEVDEVVPQFDKNKQKIVDKYNVDAISVGSDWKGRYPKVSCEMVYIDYTPSISSTIIKEKLNLVT